MQCLTDCMFFSTNEFFFVACKSPIVDLGENFLKFLKGIRLLALLISTLYVICALA